MATSVVFLNRLPPTSAQPTSMDTLPTTIASNPPFYLNQPTYSLSSSSAAPPMVPPVAQQHNRYPASTGFNSSPAVAQFAAPPEWTPSTQPQQKAMTVSRTSSKTSRKSNRDVAVTSRMGSEYSKQSATAVLKSNIKVNSRFENDQRLTKNRGEPASYSLFLIMIKNSSCINLTPRINLASSTFKFNYTWFHLFVSVCNHHAQIRCGILRLK